MRKNMFVDKKKGLLFLISESMDQGNNFKIHVALRALLENVCKLLWKGNGVKIPKLHNAIGECL